MSFNTLQFAGFILSVFGALAVVRYSNGRKLLLLVASYMFIIVWQPICGLLLATVTCISYYFGQRIYIEQARSRRRILLVASIASVTAFLLWFKYAGFFSSNLISVLHPMWPGAHLLPIKVLLPIGISFYTFRALSYLIDVYWQRSATAKSLIDYALYIAFFPQLIAGPIMRAREFLPQISRRLAVRFDPNAVIMICSGLIKKVAIADNLAPLVEAVYGNIHAASSASLWLATLCFSVQIYCDFSGYSDIAIGISMLLGFDVARNFDRPYLAISPAKFWQRWNISLSTWLRDYLYMPLGGLDPRRRWLAMLLTMLLAGLWHGAAWTFVLWGGFQGLLLIGYRIYSIWIKRWPSAKLLRGNILVKLASWAACQYCILVGWIIFRAGSVDDMLVALRKFVLIDWHVGLAGLAELPLMTISLLLVFFWLAHGLLALKDLRPAYAKLPLPAIAAAAALTTAILVIMWPPSSPPFIYFQF